MPEGSVLKMWRRLSWFRLGRSAFSVVVCRKAPYFSTVRPWFEKLDRGHCTVFSKKRRAVENHLGTFHAIAMCNLAELAAGMATEASVPTTHRWIPKQMHVEYLKKASSDLRAIAQIETFDLKTEGQDLEVPVSILNVDGEVVLSALITMWISPRRSRDRLDNPLAAGKDCE